MRIWWVLGQRVGTNLRIDNMENAGMMQDMMPLLPQFDFTCLCFSKSSHVQSICSLISPNFLIAKDGFDTPSEQSLL